MTLEQIEKSTQDNMDVINEHVSKDILENSNVISIAVRTKAYDELIVCLCRAMREYGMPDDNSIKDFAETLLKFQSDLITDFKSLLDDSENDIVTEA